jgi:hypothetical protein
MKGVILNEFTDFAETTFAAAMADQREVSGPDGGWDANARYDPEALARLIGRVSAATGIATPEVLRRFGAHLFGRFAALYPVFFLEDTSCLDFLAGIDTTIHGEIQKLYPDAEFPRFECARPAADRLELTYRSDRGLADFAEGLLLGCIAYFGEPIRLERRDPSGSDGHVAQFSLTRQPAAASGARRG